MLYLVPTPVGNMADMTFRAVDVLKNVDLILAEDTRTSRPLLAHYGINTPLQAYHIFNEHQTVNTIVDRLQSGQNIAVVTDAGTPGISDPGFLLVRQAVAAGVPVECLPGATAFVPALIDSALPCDKFVFEGFLPHKKGRQSALKRIADEERTVVLYESPHRLARLLTEMSEHFGSDRRISVSREISKLHAETVRGTVAEVMDHFGSNTIKGEIVVVVSGKVSKEPQNNDNLCQ